MNLLLTGGTGYIGSHIAVTLAAKNHRPVLYDNLANSTPEVVERINKIIEKKIDFIEGDVRDTAHLSRSIREQHIDAVIHLAGLKAVGESNEKPIDYYGNNVHGTISLLEAMQSTAVRVLVFSSSATVYGEPQYLPIDEKHPTCANSPYGRCKLHIEEILADVARADESYRIISLRYFNPVGAHSSGLIGEDPNDTPNNLMPYITQVAIGKLPRLNIFGNDYPTTDGTGIRDYIHVMDLAEGHIAALDYLVGHQGWHTFNLGTGKGYSVLEIIKSFEKATGQSIPYRFVQRRAGDVTSCYAKVDKAIQGLGWRAIYTLDEMCDSSWRFQKMAAK